MEPLETTQSEEKNERNADLITGEPGSHPISTGVGAAGAGTIGAIIGTAVAGPLGAVAGAAVGALVGGYGGSAIGEAVDPSRDDSKLVGASVESPVTSVFETNLDNDPELSPYVAGSESGTIRGPIADSTKLVSTIEESRIEPKPQQIADRAYRIYKLEGSVDGHDVDHWLQAERELSLI